MKLSFLASKASLLRHRPLVVGTLTHSGPLLAQLRRAKSGPADVVELRLDGFSKAYGPFQRVQEFGRALIREIRDVTRLPILLTFRAPNERGADRVHLPVDDTRRSEILARLLPSVDLVDVEIRRAEFARRITVIAHLHGVDVIHSTHDFSGPGRFPALSKLSALSARLKGDVFKVAVSPETNDQLETFLHWGQGLKNRRKILIGMGATGLISRVVGFSFGSILTYGHLGQSAAPGQLPVGDLAASIRSVYPCP